MAQYFPREIRALGAVPPNNIGGEPGVGDRPRLYRATIELDKPWLNDTSFGAQILTTDTVLLAKVPPGMRFLYGMLTTSVSLGASTIAIGIAGTTGLYRAAAVCTAVNTRTLFGTAAGMDVSYLTAEQSIILTTAVAALPNGADNTLIVDLYFGNV